MPLGDRRRTQFLHESRLSHTHSKYYSLARNVGGFYFGSDYTNLYSVAENGSAALIGAHGIGVTALFSLGFDDTTGTLYGVNNTDSSLYRISTSTGVATLIGSTGQPRLTDIAVDPATGQMFGVGNGTGPWFSINKESGLATQIAPLSQPTALGLAIPIHSSNLTAFGRSRPSRVSGFSVCLWPFVGQPAIFFGELECYFRRGHRGIVEGKA